MLLNKSGKTYRKLPVAAFRHGTLVRLRDLDAVRGNYRIFAARAALTASRCGVVLKADAYGLGAAPVAQALYQSGARDFFVEDCIEGTALRPHLAASDARIHVMGGLLDGNQDEFYRFGLTPCVNELSELERWNSYAEALGVTLPVAIHIDSGMNRIGLDACDVEHLSTSFRKLTSRCDVVLYMSHLADIKGNDMSMSYRQLSRLRDLIGGLPARPVSLSCTDGVTLLPNQDFNCDMVRIGVGLIGGSPNASAVLPGLRPAMEVYARISQVKWISKGETIGYGGAFTAAHDTRIAIVHIGYKDGYIRQLSRTGTRPAGAWMAVGGFVAPVIGLISMGLTTIDVSNVPEDVLQECPYAEIIGPNVDMRALADLGGCYELMASLGRFNPRLSDYLYSDFA